MLLIFFVSFITFFDRISKAKSGYRITALPQLSKLMIGVRLPLPAQQKTIINLF